MKASIKLGRVECRLLKHVKLNRRLGGGTEPNRDAIIYVGLRKASTQPTIVKLSPIPANVVI